jgi:hypothetical protein
MIPNFFRMMFNERMSGKFGDCCVVLLITCISCTKTHERVECGGYHTTEFGSSMRSEPLFPYLSKWVNWEFIEDQVSVAQRLRLMDTVYWYNSMYGHTGNPDYIHVLDLNADDIADYIYCGPGPGFDTKEMITIIKINGMVLTVSGVLKSLDFERRVLTRLYLERSVETDSTNVKKQTSYQVIYKEGKPTLKIFFQSETPDTTELPESLYDKYQRTTFCGDSIILSSKPDNINSFPRKVLPTSYGFVL